MGPILIFDKSALQCISLDESVFLQNFFLTNLTPLFYIETLADLEKEVKAGKTPERVVGELAYKTPEHGMYPNIFHNSLVLQDILGQPVDMSKRPIIKGGIPKITTDGKIGFYFDESPEKKAMDRWQNGQFLEIEREDAKLWRQNLSNLSFEVQMAIVKNIVPPSIHFSNLNDIKVFVDKFISQKDKSILDLLVILLEIPKKYHELIYVRWEKEQRPPINSFAPYTSYVLSVDLVFYLGLIQSFISKDRPSNKIDLSYLYYLPFCMIFVSSDKLHERTAPLFLKPNQLFIKGQEFKNGLKELDDYYTNYQDEINKLGLMSFATYPPKDSFIGRVWDVMGTKWREDSDKKSKVKDLPKNDALLKFLNDRVKNAKTFSGAGSISSDNANHVVFSHKVHINKGKWRILPEGIENKSNNE